MRLVIVLMLSVQVLFPGTVKAASDSNLDTVDQITDSTNPDANNIIKDLHLPPLILNIYKVIPKPSAQTIVKTSTQVFSILGNAGLKRIDQKKYSEARQEKFKEIESEFDSMITNFKMDFNIYSHSAKLKSNQNDFFTSLEEKNTTPRVAGDNISLENQEIQKIVLPKNKSLWQRIYETFFATTISSEEYSQ